MTGDIHQRGGDVEFWQQMETRGQATVMIDGVRVGEGHRVRLRPRSSADIFDVALRGQVGVVESVEEDEEGHTHLAVTVESDPGRDLGEARMPGHRFFFAIEDVEPLADQSRQPEAARILVAGIGNIFLGDDGFGVEVVRRVHDRGHGPGADVVDFGIRGMDLVYAMQRDYFGVIFVDAAPRGQPPGTVTVLEPELPEHGSAMVETHGMDPVAALRMATQLGPIPPHRRVVCCEPESVMSGSPDEDIVVELSTPVRAAIEEAARQVESLITELSEIRDQPSPEAGGGEAR